MAHIKGRIKEMKLCIRRISDDEIKDLRNLFNKEYDRRFEAETQGKQITGATQG